jgi:hypothetical protein
VHITKNADGFSVVVSTSIFPEADISKYEMKSESTAWLRVWDKRQKAKLRSALAGAFPPVHYTTTDLRFFKLQCSGLQQFGTTLGISLLKQGNRI